jgi:tRNA dimethylallyltransferase
LAEGAPSRLLAIVGPTATGKTDLSLDLAERLGGEIVSADSVQVYRGFDIGSGKPSLADRARAPHHFIDTCDPTEPIDAATYAREASRVIAEIRNRDRVPILCGGTYFWVRALVLGLMNAPPGDRAIRERHKALVDEKGRAALHASLAAVDPVGAARLHPNDVVRVSRALEIFELSGRTITEWQAAHGFREKQMEATLVGIPVPPDRLTERIAKRVDHWLETGWIDEVRELIRLGYGASRAMGSVGYAEVRAYLGGSLERSDLRTNIVRSTRIFARRQRTWLKGAGVEWLE